IPAGTTHDVALVAVYQKDSEGENIGGSGGSSGGGGGGGGSRGSSGRRGTVTPNNVATGTPTATQPSNTQPNTNTAQPNTAQNRNDDKQHVTEPSPQKNADTLTRQTGEGLSPYSGKRATNRSAAVGTNKGRLPKTGEAPFAPNVAGTLAGLLLGAYALCGRRRKEQ
ncbi:LPXTG cell wall anchor domain-containing protein, partial [Stomatobaculum longum]|uniref:LPXTG cell wall anchor domain-containing protein n=1 Tax=Stomatobaculum longum TaxID=796942 RepID=UPI0028DB725E